AVRRLKGWIAEPIPDLRRVTVGRSSQSFDGTEMASRADVIPRAMGALCGRGRDVQWPTHLYARVSFPSPDVAGLLCRLFDIRHVFSSVASHAASDGLIWPKDGCASIACAATTAVRLSFPWLRPFLARQESLSAAILRCASARRRVRRRSPSACRSPSRPRWSRARTAKEK